MQRRSFLKFFGLAAASPVAATAAEKFAETAKKLNVPVPPKERFLEKEYGTDYAFTETCFSCYPEPLTVSELREDFGLRRRRNS